MDPDAPTRRYAGRCHCGAVRFALRCPEITTAVRCNCSMCVRKGATMSSVYFGPDEIAVEGLEALCVYRFGDVTVSHYFCPVCGVAPFHDAIERPGHYRINLGCIDGLDLDALAVSRIDGAAF